MRLSSVLFFSVFIPCAFIASSRAGEQPPAPATPVIVEQTPAQAGQKPAGAGDKAPAPPANTDEPEKRGFISRAPGTFDGWTLLSPLNSLNIQLVDMDGKVVHTWVAEEVPGGAVYLLDNGHLLRCGQQEGNPRFHGGGIGGRIEEIDWDGKIVWDYELISDQVTQHHDMRRLANGNLLMIAWEYHSPEEARAHGRDADAIADEGLWSDVVYEVKPTPPHGGEVVWKWRTWDHLVQDRDAKLADFGVVRAEAGRIDINADHRYLPKTETDEERKKREERMRQMKAVGYTGGNDPDELDADTNRKLDHPDKPDHPDKLDKADKLDKPDKPVGSDKLDKADGLDKPDKLKSPDKLDKFDKTGMPPNKPDKGRKSESDWLHTNAIDYNPELDLILLSTPHLSELWVIDHSTTTAQAAGKSGGRWGKGGELLYRYGNPQNYQAGKMSDRKSFGQHNATWLTDAPAGANPGANPGANKGELRVLFFNNGADRPVKEYSSVDELVLPFDRTRGFTRAADQAFGPAEPAWSYSDPDHFFSGFISGAQRLPNGNTLICAGAPGHVFEVTRDKRIVWDFWNPFGGEVEPTKLGGKAPPKALFRATRIAKDHPGVKL